MNYQIYSNDRRKLEELFYHKEKQLSSLNKPRIDQESVRFCSFNVHAFMEANTNPKSFKKMLSEIDADVIGILEYDQESDDEHSYMRYLGYSYGYKVDSRDTVIALFSRLPIDSPKTICLGGPNNAIICDISGMTLCLLHLTFNNQATRLSEIKTLLELEDRPNLVMGDFNSTMIEAVSNPPEFRKCYLERTKVKYSSRLFELLKKNCYQDSFEAAMIEPVDRPYSTHWSTNRIDYIFVESCSKLVVFDSSVYHTTLSDHIPVIIDIKDRCP